MARLREAIAAYPVRAGGHVLIEYVLIAGLNDQPDHARELAEYLVGLSTCVNLIPMNPIDGSPFTAPSEAACDEFQTVLMQCGQLAFRRWTKGRQAMAACGQLGNVELRRRPTALSAVH
jgi:23S rRNA (adenine2503-C2)-methyltransferase